MFAGSIAAQEKKTLTTEDYKQWERLSSATISQDGVWVGYRITLNEGNDTLFIVNSQTDSIFKEAFGTGLQYSADSKWAAYRIGVSQKKQEQMQEKKESVRYKLALLNLQTGEKTIYKEVSSFSFPRNGHHMVMNTYKAKGSKAKGNSIVLLNLETGKMRTIGNVTQHSFNKKGDFLAYITQPDSPVGQGVEVFDLRDYSIKILASDTCSFSNLTWQKEGESLAFLHQIENEDYEEDNQQIYAFRNVYKGFNEEVFSPCKMDAFPEGMRVEKSRLQWADDQSALFFGIKDWNMTKKAKKKLEEKEKEGEDDKDAKKDDEDTGKDEKGEGEGEEKGKDKEKDDKDKKEVKKDDAKLPGVDVWHWKDPYIQPRQQKTYNQDKNFTLLSMWNIDDKRFLQIADTITKHASLTGDQKMAYVNTKEPYEPQFRMTYADYSLMDLSTGVKTPILTNFTGYLLPSPSGNYLVYFKDNNWWSLDLASKKHTNLTGDLGVPFWNIRDDHPAEVRPAFGYGGWLKDDKYVFLNDEYDVWAVKPDGSEAKKVTEGRNDEVIYRVRRMDFEKTYIDPKEPIYLSMSGDKTKKSGYAQMKWGQKPVVMLFEDKSISYMTKAKKADRFIFTESTYEQSSALYVADKDFASKKLIGTSNPQQKDYAWGKAELVNFTNKNGKDLQGVLHYPANYEAGKKYPMLVYIYEIRSNSLHSYINPSDMSSYNTTNYVQQGFFVFQPDIVYRTNDPGISAVECVVPAVEKVLETGMIDKDKIGLMGHSWGAYQTAFIITQTDLFSAAVAGAPLTDMISMYTEVYWNSGSPNQGIFETSQGRFDKPYYDIMDKYLENSPMFQAHNIKTPLLVAFGDKDGAVDWHQGIEMYTTMRRMEKPMVMLVYAGENHSVRKKENRLDYTLKINQWFDHYLVGKEAEKWITEGIPYLEKKKKEEAKKKK